MVVVLIAVVAILPTQTFQGVCVSVVAVTDNLISAGRSTLRHVHHNTQHWQDHHGDQKVWYLKKGTNISHVLT